MIAVLATLLGLLGAGRWVSQHPDGLTGAWRDVTDFTAAEASGQLPLADHRWFPAPGYEEADAPLGVPPVVVEAGSFAFLHTDPSSSQPVTWSPCRPIHYVVNPANAPQDFEATVHAVVAEVAAATGLVFTNDGVTDEMASSSREAFLPDRYGDRWAPVLITFTDAQTDPHLVGRVRGIASAYPIDDPETGVPHYMTGRVHLDLETLKDPVVDGEHAYVRVLRHELGHLVGLAHVDDPAELMYADGSAQTNFGPGDRAGLATLGRGACAPNL